jgi:uncharacterized protein
MELAVDVPVRIEPPPTAPDAKAFLTASWRDFLMLSYEIEPRVLDAYIPPGTELDQWQGRCFVSLVGFRFDDARLFGVRIPWHQHFAEVNLRFYARRRVAGAWRRGVVFLRELAAKRAVTAVAKWFYGERFRYVPLQCRVEGQSRGNAPRRIEYAWRDRGGDFLLAGEVLDAPQMPEPGSLEEFVVEHYWAYNAARRGGATEYLVTHPPWRIATADGAFTGDAYRQYGPRFAPFLRGEPASAFWADGSGVEVFRGSRP